MKGWLSPFRSLPSASKREVRPLPRPLPCEGNALALVNLETRSDRRAWARRQESPSDPPLGPGGVSVEARWRIELFGGLRVQQGEQVLTRLRTQKTAPLLAYLAYYRQRTHP